MGSCSRCLVEYLICRRGKHGRDQVIEVIRPPTSENPSPNDWTQYEIWAPLDQYKGEVTPGDPRLLFLDGVAYQWHMTVFSEMHSLDKDCNHPNRGKPNCGFPNRRLPAAGLDIRKLHEMGDP